MNIIKQSFVSSCNIQLDSLLGTGGNNMNETKQSTCFLQEAHSLGQAHGEDGLPVGLATATESSLRAASLAVCLLFSPGASEHCGNM